MKFKILTNEWEIIKTHAHNHVMLNNDLCYGKCSYLDKKIYINEELCGCGSKELQTLRHELIHAFLDETVLSRQETFTEEEVCEVYAKFGGAIEEIVKEWCEHQCMNEYLYSTPYK